MTPEPGRYPDRVADRFFPYDFDVRYQWIWWPLGVRENDGVTITDDGGFVATFGGWRVETPLSNIKGWQVSGPYRWYRAVGLRGSRVDSGITFGTTPRGGVCVLFAERIPQVVPPRPSHSGLTVTVKDREGLVAALSGS
jgi:hypothetical protein